MRGHRGARHHGERAACATSRSAAGAGGRRPRAAGCRRSGGCRRAAARCRRTARAGPSWRRRAVGRRGCRAAGGPGARSPVRWPVSLSETSRGGRTTVSEALSTRSRHSVVERAAEQVAGVDADHAAVGDDEHVVAVRMGGGDAVHGRLHARRCTSGSGSPPGGGQSCGARSQATVGIARPGRGPRRPCSPPTRRATARAARGTTSAARRCPRRASSAVSTARRIRAHVGGAHAIAAQPRGRAPRPGRGRARRARCRCAPWKRRSAFHIDSPWRASSSLTPPHREPRARAQARQRLVAAEQRQHVEERRRGGAARDREARELGQVHELEPERRDELAVESPRSRPP